MDSQVIYCCCCKYNLIKMCYTEDQKDNREQKLFDNLYKYKKEKSKKIEQLIKKLKLQN